MRVSGDNTTADVHSTPGLSDGIRTDGSQYCHGWPESRLSLHSFVGQKAPKWVRPVKALLGHSKSKLAPRYSPPRGSTKDLSSLGLAGSDILGSRAHRWVYVGRNPNLDIGSFPFFSATNTRIGDQRKREKRKKIGKKKKERKERKERDKGKRERKKREKREGKEKEGRRRERRYSAAARVLRPGSHSHPSFVGVAASVCVEH